jgi:ABC-type cobalt transport system substrate-binding protein
VPGKRFGATIVLAAATGLGVLGLAMATGEREGTDSSAMALADTLRAGSKPESPGRLLVPDPEEEKFLFAAQAALGAGLIGYGFLAARAKKRMR